MSNLHRAIKYLIRSEYSLRSEIFTNISNHIDNLNQKSIIHHTNRNKYIVSLNNLIKKLNDSYNKIIRIYKKKNYVLTERERDLIETKNYEGLYEYISMLKNQKVVNADEDRIKLDYFEECDQDMLSLMEQVGSMKISDMVKLVVGNKYDECLAISSSEHSLREFVQDNKKTLTLDVMMKEMHNSMALFNIIDQSFTPVEIYCKKGMDITSILVKKFGYDDRFSVGSEESSKFKFEIMMENCYRITIKIKNPNLVFVAIGFFNYDVIGTKIATSQICNNFIHCKKKLLIEYVKENAHINKSYKSIYLANLSLGEILCYKGDEMIDRMLSDYGLYTKACKPNFKETINDFVNVNLSKKFNMLKCLLLGPKDSVKRAAMLFGMAKDQYRDTKNNEICCADILYRNLNHSQQLKLKRTGQHIKQDMDRIKKITSDDIDLKQQCLMNNSMSDYIKKCALSRLEEMKSSNSDYHKNHQYVKTLVEYPWVSPNYEDMFTTIGGNREKCKEKLKQIKTDLDLNVFGHEECKNVMCDIVGKWFSNPNSMGKAIGLEGPPGVGKTLIASGLGKVLGIPYQEFHLGGLEDGSVLAGHSFTYSGAQPGLIVTKMVAAGEPRTILFFDELDKACTKHGINEIFNILIHVTDQNTNDKFNDKFFQDIPFPLNKCVFVFSFNDRSKIDPILLDRMEIITINPYSLNDKLQIGKNYLMPELMDGVGIERDSLVMTPQTIEYLISNYTLEAGVRSLKNKMEKIFLKLNIDRIYGRGPFKQKEKFSKENPIRLNKQHVIKYLGKPKMTIDRIHDTDQIGVVNGMYATTVGAGGILPILVYPARNASTQFKLEITGKQGKVMKESINFSWTIAKNCVKADTIKKFYQNNPGGIHVHNPDGATPKDGPSAGSGYTTAFISRITGCAVKHEIAMTGEIGIGGMITAIGGLECKLSGAKVAGVRLVFVCKKNIDDVRKIKESNPSLFNLINPMGDKDVTKIIDELCKKKNSNVGDFKIIMVNTIFDVVRYALVDPEYVEAHYPDGVYDVVDQTFDDMKYMVKTDGGFHTIHQNHPNMDMVVVGDEIDDEVDEEDEEDDEDEEDEDDKDSDDE